MITVTCQFNEIIGVIGRRTAAEEYAFTRLAEGRLIVSQTEKLLDLSVYDVQRKAEGRGLEIGATAEQYGVRSRRSTLRH